MQYSYYCDLCDYRKYWISFSIWMELPDWDSAWYIHVSTSSVNMADIDICPICELKCDICQYTFNKNCTVLTKTEFDGFIKYGSQDWNCSICAESLFPINHAVGNEDFLNILNEFYNASYFNNPESMQKEVFNPFKLNEDNEYISCIDIDLDNCCYHDISCTVQSIVPIAQKTLDFFHNSFQKRVRLHVFHMNIRSNPWNLNKLIEILSNRGRRFHIIGITETWLNGIQSYANQGAKCWNFYPQISKKSKV